MRDLLFGDYAPAFTTRILSRNAAGPLEYGTGFFFTFSFPERKTSAPVIVTNKHVVANATSVEFTLSVGDADDVPVPGPGHSFSVDLAGKMISHPDPAVDLVAIPLAGVLKQAKAAGISVGIVSFDEKALPSADELNSYGAIPDVYVTGYPRAIIDPANNAPIVRRGIAATDPRLDYEGRKEFLIDMAVLPGASGSPVVVHESGMVRHGTDFELGVTRTRLLGIVYAAQTYLADGTVVRNNAPAADDKVQVIAFANLGICIKARRLLDFKPLIEPVL